MNGRKSTRSIKRENDKKRLRRMVVQIIIKLYNVYTTSTNTRAFFLQFWSLTFKTSAPN